MIEEMMEDTFEGLEDDDLEEEADKEVDKVLFEITNGELDPLEKRQSDSKGSQETVQFLGSEHY